MRLRISICILGLALSVSTLARADARAADKSAGTASSMPASARPTVAAVLADPNFDSWHRALESQVLLAQEVRKSGGIAEVCGTNDKLRRLALKAHHLRLQLLDSLADRGITPTPPPPGVAPWPWGAAAGSEFIGADFDSLNTAVIVDDGRIVFTNLRGVPEVDTFLASQAFYASHEDEYDFLMLFTNFHSDLLGGQFRAFHQAVANDIEGLGYRNTSMGDFFDDSEMYTKRQEDGALQSFVHLNSIDLFPDDPQQNYWLSYSSVAFMAHEIGHRWGTRLRLWLPGGGIQNVLLGRGNVHWSFFLNTKASVLEGNEWIDEFGQLRTTRPSLNYGALDLYLMGMLHPSEVPPDQLWYLDNIEACDPELDLAGNTRSPVSPPEENVLCIADKISFTMDNVFLANGLRRPLYPDTQRAFKVATALVVRNGVGVSAGDLEKIERFRDAMKDFFSTQTMGRGSLDMQVRSIPARVVFEHRAQGNVEDAQSPIEIRTRVDLVQRSLPTTLDDLSLGLLYSVDGTPFVEMVMVRGQDGEYTATLPPQPIDSSIRYYLRASSDFPGHEFLWPEDAPEDVFEFNVVPDVQAPSIVHLPRRRHSRQAEPLLVRSLVRDEHGVENVRIEYRVAGGTLRSQGLPVQGVSDVYEARIELPGRVGDIVEYRIVASDVSSTPHVAFAPGSGFYELELMLPQLEDAEEEDPLWTHRSLKIDGSDQWHREPINHTPGGFRSWKCGPENVSSFPRVGEIELLQDAVLVTPAVRMFADWELSFWHRYYFRLAPPDADDSAVDGAIIEWQDVEVLQDVLADKWYLIDPVDGYNNQFGSYAFFNELRGYPCWSGEHDVWKLERVDPSITFHEFAGRLIRFRFRVATSAPLFLTTPRAGWYLDDLVIHPGTPMTPVVLESFQAERIDAGVRLSWRARDVEAGDAFRIYRAAVEGNGAAGAFELVATQSAFPSTLQYEFIDTNARSTEPYTYRLGLLTRGVETLTSSIAIGETTPRFRLERNHPNPFNPSTVIRFELPRRGPAQLIVYDVQGRRVRTLINGTLDPGAHRVNWNGSNDHGQPVASGVYLYRLTSQGRRASHRMLLVR